ncbi:hypothetical protein NUM3379_36520 [Kineococcus sp. NUM-3379]
MPGSAGSPGHLHAHLAGHAHGGGADPGWFLPLAVLAAGLGLHALAVARRRRRSGRGWSRWRTASWVVGVLLVAAALSPPVVGSARQGVSGHVVQHLLLGMFAPLGLVLAAPFTLLLGAVPPAVGRRLGAVLRSAPVHVVAHPAVAVVLDVGVLWAVHLTPLHALTARHPALGGLVLVHYLLAGCLFTWAVAGPDPAPRRPGFRVRVGALLVAVAAHATLARSMAARAAGLDGAAAVDLEQAARWMYAGGDGAELLLAVALFAGRYRRDRPRGAGTATGRAASPGPAGGTRAG